MQSESLSEALFEDGQKPFFNGGLHAGGIKRLRGKLLQSKNGLMDEHAETVHGLMTAFLRFFQKSGSERAVDEITYRGRDRKRVEKLEIGELCRDTLHAERGTVDEQFCPVQSLQRVLPAERSF